jgi:diadenosine tetraphosphate (Ap4A) HIT family hydrolase
MDDFSENKIKEYKYWTVFIHENQSYLGRCVVWCKRENALDLIDATKEEREELFLILKELKKALIKTFQPDWFNYSFLGNSTQHLHCHLVPRYAKPRIFEGIQFEDKLFGHNWRTDHNFIIPEAVLNKIKLALINSLK